ncbi:MAG: DUF929 family protein [Acidimicrobiales bacterium]|nr:DUF929 family protein [Acidimicrobiales bacterium]
MNMWIAGGAVLVVLAVVGAIVGIRLSSGGGSASESQPVASGVMNDVSNVPASTFEQVGLPGSNVIIGTPMSTRRDSHGNLPNVLTRNGLPVVVYEGGEFCPYCAAERWSLVVALSRFGTFANLHTTTSSSTDTFPNTRTFTFVGSRYTSRYLAFDPVELLDRNHNPLQQPTSEQQRLLTTYDVPPYTQVSGGIPFVSFANQSVITGPGFSPAVLQGLSWATIAGDLYNSKSPVSQAVLGSANYITAAVCQITHGQPGNVCNASFIASAQAKIASASPGAKGSSS